MTPQDILEAVATEAGITVTELGKRDQRHRFVRPRQVAGYLLRAHFPELSYKKIALRLGYRDHKTVWCACRQLPDLIRCDVRARGLYDRVRSRLDLHS